MSYDEMKLACLKHKLVVCWFIGGPWKDSLRPVSKHYVESRSSLVVPVESLSDWIPAIEAGFDDIATVDCRMETVEYHRQIDLETGVPVFSCLSRIDTGGGCFFGLRSVMQSRPLPDAWQKLIDSGTPLETDDDGSSDG